MPHLIRWDNRVELALAEQLPGFCRNDPAIGDRYEGAGDKSLDYGRSSSQRECIPGCVDSLGENRWHHAHEVVLASLIWEGNGANLLSVRQEPPKHAQVGAEAFRSAYRIRYVRCSGWGMEHVSQRLGGAEKPIACRPGGLRISAFPRQWHCRSSREPGNDPQFANERFGELADLFEKFLDFGFLEQLHRVCEIQDKAIYAASTARSVPYPAR